MASTIPFKKPTFVIKDDVKPEEVDIYAKRKAADDKSFKLKTILNAWEQQQEQERTLRKGFATSLLFGMFVQIYIMSVLFVLIGLNILKFEQWTVNIFIVSVFAELTSMVYWVVKYLFPHTNLEILNILKEL